MNVDKYYIWLLLAVGEGRPEISQLIKRFGTAQKAYEAFESNTALLGAELTAKAQETGLDKAEKLLSSITVDGTELITWESEEYPEHLRRTENPPCVLFAKGDSSLLSKKLVTIVGARAMTDYTASVIPDIIERIDKDYAIVGTLSEGCDQLTCLNALKYGVAYIEVMPCGLSRTYPAGSRSLRRFLLENGGLLISEFLPKTNSSQGSFLRRSRIIGGISYVTLVMQAGAKSGTLNTAEYSSAPLFVPPHDIFRKDYSGAVNAVRKGAKLYLGPTSIDKAYEHALEAEKESEETADRKRAKYRTVSTKDKGSTADTKNGGNENASPEKNAGKAPERSDFDSDEQFSLYMFIAGSGSTVSLEEILAGTGRSPESLAEDLLDLEIAGKISCAGSRYSAV